MSGACWASVARAAWWAGPSGTPPFGGTRPEYVSVEPEASFERRAPRVAFDVESGPKGMHAVNIRALTDGGIETEGANDDGVNGSALSDERINGAGLILEDATSPMPA